MCLYDRKHKIKYITCRYSYERCGGVTDYSVIVGIINDFHKRINHLMICNNFTTFNIHTVYVLIVEKNFLLKSALL